MPVGTHWLGHGIAFSDFIEVEWLCDYMPISGAGGAGLLSLRGNDIRG